MGIPGAPGITMGPDGTVQATPQITPQQRALQLIQSIGQNSAAFNAGRPQMPGQQTGAVVGGAPPQMSPGLPGIPGATNPLPPTGANTPVLAGGGGMPRGGGGGGGSIAPSGAANSFTFGNKRAAKTSSTFDILQSFVGVAKKQEEAKKTKEVNEGKYLLLELDKARQRAEAGDPKAQQYYNELLADKRTQKILKDIQGYAPQPMEEMPTGVKAGVAAAQEISKQQQQQQGQQAQKPGTLQSLLQRFGGAANGAGQAVKSNLTGQPNLPAGGVHPVPGPSQSSPQQLAVLDKASSQAIASFPKDVQPLMQSVIDIGKTTPVPGAYQQAVSQVLQSALGYKNTQAQFGNAMAMAKANNDSKFAIQQLRDATLRADAQAAAQARMYHDDKQGEFWDKRLAEDTKKFEAAMATKLEVAEIGAHKLTSKQMENNFKLQAGSGLALETVDRLMDNMNYIKEHPYKTVAGELPGIGRMTGLDDKGAQVSADMLRLREQMGLVNGLYGGSGMGQGGGVKRYQALIGMSGTSAMSNPKVTLDLLKGVKEDLTALQSISNKVVAEGKSQESTKEDNPLGIDMTPPGK